nr:ATP-binding protein [Campylobacter sp.]
MKVNLREAVKKLAYGNIDFFRPLYEAIINSIQAEADEINIEVNHYSIDDKKIISSYSVKDNGIGFTDENIESFLTLWTDKNSDKGALGSGRILCLKVFDNIIIESQTKN